MHRAVRLLRTLERNVAVWWIAVIGRCVVFRHLKCFKQPNKFLEGTHIT